MHRVGVGDRGSCPMVPYTAASLFPQGDGKTLQYGIHGITTAGMDPAAWTLWRDTLSLQSPKAYLLSRVDLPTWKETWKEYTRSRPKTISIYFSFSP